MAPLQFGVPGGPELLVMLLILLLLAVPVLVVVLLLSRARGRSERLDEIERRIGRIEARVDHLENGDGTGSEDRTRDVDGTGSEGKTRDGDETRGLDDAPSGYDAGTGDGGEVD